MGDCHGLQINRKAFEEKENSTCCERAVRAAIIPPLLFAVDTASRHGPVLAINET
jgi:hypothetical protein